MSAIYLSSGMSPKESLSFYGRTHVYLTPEAEKALQNLENERFSKKILCCRVATASFIALATFAAFTMSWMIGGGLLMGIAIPLRLEIRFKSRRLNMIESIKRKEEVPIKLAFEKMRSFVEEQWQIKRRIIADEIFFAACSDWSEKRVMNFAKQCLASFDSTKEVDSLCLSEARVGAMKNELKNLSSVIYGILQTSHVPSLGVESWEMLVTSCKRFLYGDFLDAENTPVNICKDTYGQWKVCDLT